MKFTEEQAREALRAELTNKGRKSLAMSERTLAKMTESLCKRLADEEMGLPDFVEIAVEILSPVNDNIRKDKSDFANKWKEEHPSTETPTETKPAEAPKGNPELEALKAEIEALKAKNAENERQSKLSAKKSELVAALGTKGIKDKEWIDSFLSEVNITEDMDVESKAENYAKFYNKSQANVPPTPTPFSPTGGGNGDIPESVKAAKELAKKNREQLNKQ